MSMTPARDPFDEVLDQSSPRTTPLTPDVMVELKRLGAITGAAAGARPRRWARPAVAALVAALVFGGVATAAAATGMWTLPWAQSDSIASFSYTLPSGIECEQRIGGVSGTVPAAIEATEDFYRDTDLAALLTDDAIQATIERRRGGESVHVNPDGSRVPGGFGTEYYSADQEYMTAVWDIVVTAMDADLARRGMTGVDNELTLQSEPNCPGVVG
ncbi:hypothetical protein [Compostimonas suwonensis]|uniref:Uncharacterized protein n=1 Tax=Compostimonas suwonensis TaxID=1048394 RepID=A0A2M9C4G2_9MICO|nr:hypothetical protein [Compostimonas suwonensis]PJJ65379.1 hypothetical protein CLV54_0412 [Compostimonas suwonensis]